MAGVNVQVASDVLAAWKRVIAEGNPEHGYPASTDAERLPRYFWTQMERLEAAVQVAKPGDTEMDGQKEYLVEVGVYSSSPLNAAWDAQLLWTGDLLPHVTVTAPDGHHYNYDLAAPEHGPEDGDENSADE